MKKITYNKLVRDLIPQIIEELADILEIVHALIELNDFQLEDVEQIRKSKQEQRGAFKEGFFLEHVID